MKKLVFAVIALAGCLSAQQPVTVPGWAGGTLGAMANYGTSPGAVLVPGVNAFVTNTVTVSVPTWAGGTLGAMANYGTSPGAVLVPGVNAFITNSPSVSFAPSSASGNAMTIKHSSTAAAANIKASAGNLYAFDVSNNGAIPCWIQLFNTAGTPTAGTSVIDSYMVQAGVSRTVQIGAFALENFATGIGFAGATADSGATTTGCTTTISTTFYYQ